MGVPIEGWVVPAGLESVFPLSQRRGAGLSLVAPPGLGSPMIRIALPPLLRQSIGALLFALCELRVTRQSQRQRPHANVEEHGVKMGAAPASKMDAKVGPGAGDVRGLDFGWCAGLLWRGGGVELSY